MDLISLLLVLFVLGIVFWLVTTYLIPLFPPPLRTIAIVIFVIIAIIVLLSLIGVMPSLGSIRVGR